jgi:hypothetical protein
MFPESWWQGNVFDRIRDNVVAAGIANPDDFRKFILVKNLIRPSIEKIPL